MLELAETKFGETHEWTAWGWASLAAMCRSVIFPLTCRRLS